MTSPVTNSWNSPSSLAELLRKRKESEERADKTITTALKTALQKEESSFRETLEKSEKELRNSLRMYMLCARYERLSFQNQNPPDWLNEQTVLSVRRLQMVFFSRL